MSGILPLFLYILALFMFLAACFLHMRRTGTRHPIISGIAFFILISVVSYSVPSLRPISLFRIGHALVGEYLDLFWLLFYLASTMLLAIRLKRKAVQLIVIVSIAFFTASGNFGSMSLDLSRDDVFSLRPYTRSVLGRLDSECLITWYRTDSFADSFSGTSFSMILERYEHENPEHITLLTENPLERTSPEFPEKLGLEPLVNGEYSGVLLEYRGKSRLVPALTEHTLAEYELTRSLATLLEKPRDYPVQLLVSNDSGYEQNHLRVLLEHAGFTTMPVQNPTDYLDDSIPLIVQGSRHIDRQTAHAIEMFLDRGGNALCMVSGVTVDVTGDWSARSKDDDGIITLLQKQGLTITNQLVRDNNHYTIIMNSLDGKSVETVPYPYWVQIPESGFLSEHPVFSGISSLQLYWPSPVVLENTTFLPLVHTGENTHIVSPPFDTRPLKENRAAESGSGEIAVLGGIVDKHSRLIVIADQYAVSSLVDFTAGWDNFLFFVNCVEWISERDYLTVLKRRQPESFPVVRRLFP